MRVRFAYAEREGERARARAHTHTQRKAFTDKGPEETRAGGLRPPTAAAGPGPVRTRDGFSV